MNEEEKIGELLASIAECYACLDANAEGRRANFREVLPYDRQTMEAMLKIMDEIDAVDPTVIAFC